MTLSQFILIAGALIGLAGLLVPVAYFVARAASIGWYRTRLEHHRKIMNEINGESDNGR